jgi:hypothetical protein
MLVGVQVLLFGGTAAAAAEVPGSISGNVTSAATSSPLAGVEVCAVRPAPAVASEEEEEEAAPEPPPTCAATNAAGEYTLTGISPGSYWVVFNPAEVPSPSGFSPSTVDYVSQAWDGAHTEAAARTVAVSSGGKATGIDAALAPGGEIAGHVRAAAGSGLAGAFVCAQSSSAAEELGHFACTVTGASGEYTIYGLAPGPYDVEFFAAGYSPQIYNGQFALAQASTVNVAAGAVAEGIDATLGAAPPLGSGGPGPTSAPTPAGGGSPRSVLSGGPLMSLRSRTLTVLAPGVVQIVLTCHSSARCHGRVRLSTRASRRGDGRRRPLGGASFSIAAGRRATVDVQLDARGRALLSASRGRLDAALAVKISGGAMSAPQLLAVHLRDRGRRP